MGNLSLWHCGNQKGCAIMPFRLPCNAAALQGGTFHRYGYRVRTECLYGLLLARIAWDKWWNVVVYVAIFFFWDGEPSD
jgi:hypothetical protein